MYRYAASVAIFLSALLCAPSLAAEPDAASSPVAAPDYSVAANWICRPGAEDACTTGLDAKVVGPAGAARVERFVPAAAPAVDCFYVYPTVSNEQSVLADMQDSPEIRDVANAQVGRLSSRCRVFAPIYRQTTLFGLRKMLRGEIQDGFDAPFADVQAAWTYYLAHDNGGRGVVLIGHSQGTILLQRLIASTIDGTAQQKVIVSAFLAGDPSLSIPSGKKTGGTFAHIPVCAAKVQTGCAYAWGSYLSGDIPPLYSFGSPQDGGMQSACVNPAAPSGGSGTLKFYRRKAASAPASDPPWVETLGDLSGACKLDSTGDAFVVAVRPGPQAATEKTFLKGAELPGGWGLHREDIALVQGNILDVLDAEIAVWTAKH